RLVQRFVGPRDLGDPALALAMIERHHLVVGPVQIARDIRYLLEDPVRGVAHDSPTGLVSTSKSPWQWGHVTASRLCPVSLTRRYRSCRNIRSPDGRPSISLGLMCSSVPSRVTTRDSRMSTR